MPFFDDFVRAMETYLQDYVTVTMGGIQVQAPGTAGSINVNEVWKFSILVNNKGPLNMTNVRLHVDPQNDAMSAMSATGPWSQPGFNLPYIPSIRAGTLESSVKLYFKAPATAKPVGTALVSAYIQTWDGDLQNILTNHSIGTWTPRVDWTSQVY